MPEILLARITPSSTNPRKAFDDAKLVDLSESIKSKGVLQPILVRYAADGDFELVAGERRYRAAKLAGLSTIPATVKDLTDAEVIEVQVIENDQREDVLPSERAAGYQALIEAGSTVDQIAAKVGKSAAWVRGVLRLGQLPTATADAVDAGEIAPAVAGLIARVPGKSREKVALCVLRGADNPSNIPKAGEHEPLSYRATRDLISTHFIRELKKAPFNTKDASLPPGPCTTCEKRAGNAGDEYADIRADMCLDTDCFKSKRDLNVERETKAASADGFTVLSKKDQEDLFKWGMFNSDTYIQLDGSLPWETRERIQEAGAKEVKTLRAALGKQVCDLTEQFVAFGRDGERIEMIRISDMKREINELYPKPKKDKAQGERQITEWDVRQRARREFSEEIGEQIEGLVEEKDFEKAQNLVLKMLGHMMLGDFIAGRKLTGLPTWITSLGHTTTIAERQAVLDGIGTNALLAPLAAWVAFEMCDDVDEITDINHLAKGSFAKLLKDVEKAMVKERAAEKKTKAKAGAK